jgi:aminodeoxychorismate synthase component I
VPADLRTVLAREGTVLLDAAGRDPDSGASAARLFTQPRHVRVAATADEVPGVLAALGADVRAGAWVAGWLAYEAGYALEPRLRALAPRTRSPLAWFGVYDAPVELAREQVAVALAGVGEVGIGPPRFALPPDAYARRIAAVRRHIAEGDVYQANLTAPLHFRVEGDPLGLYAALRQRQPAPYAAWIAAAGRRVLSLSPELFFRIDGDTITARPMKGTAPRAADPSEDRRRAEALAADAKNRAENLMIVDLLRNDLARVARPGSVRVPALFEVEGYPTVWQMTSTVEATRCDGVGPADVLGALFPCGSVTGAPKIRAMELLRELEATPRGVYCGAIGYAGPGEAVFSVPIRTVELEPDGAAWAATLGLGSGVVWDSVAEEEYAECLLKGRFLTDLLPADAGVGG